MLYGDFVGVTLSDYLKKSYEWAIPIVNEES
jgi:hypothetical protein